MRPEQDEREHGGGRENQRARRRTQSKRRQEKADARAISARSRRRYTAAR